MVSYVLEFWEDLVRMLGTAILSITDLPHSHPYTAVRGSNRRLPAYYTTYPSNCREKLSKSTLSSLCDLFFHSVLSL